MLLRIQRLAWTAFGLSGAVFCCLLSYIAWQVYAPTKSYVGLKAGVSEIFAESRAVTVAMVDKGRPGKPETMGLIPSVRQIMLDSGAQIKQSGQVMTNLSSNVSTVAIKAGTTLDTLNDNLKSIKGTTDAATRFVDALREDAQAAKPVIVHADALERAGTEALDNLNGLLKDEAIGRTMRNAADASGNVEHMAQTADQLESHFAKPYLQPSRNPFKRIWQQTKPFLVSGAKITATLF